MRTPLRLFQAASALLLALTIAGEIALGDWRAPPFDPARSGPAGRSAPAANPASAPSEALVARILARPLFEQDRQARPDPGMRSAAGGALPRLTGIVSASGRRQAIFQTPGEKPANLGEGETIAGWTIKAIGRNQIELQRVGGSMTIEPAKDPAAGQEGPPVQPPAVFKPVRQ